LPEEYVARFSPNTPEADGLIAPGSSARL